MHIFTKNTANNCVNSRETNFLRRLQEHNKAAAWNGLHFKMISFTDLHQRSLTKLPCVITHLSCRLGSWLRHDFFTKYANPTAYRTTHTWVTDQTKYLKAFIPLHSFVFHLHLIAREKFRSSAI